MAAHRSAVPPNRFTFPLAVEAGEAGLAGQELEVVLHAGGKRLHLLGELRERDRVAFGQLADAASERL